MKNPSIATIRRNAALIVACVIVGALVPAIATADTTTCGVPGDSRCEAWNTRRNRGAGDVTMATAASPSGDRVFTTGMDVGYANLAANNISTLAFDGATGSLLWERAWGGAGADVPYSIAVAPSGGTVAVAGVAGESGNAADFAIVAYDAVTGAIRWAQRYDSGGYEYATDLAWSPDEASVFVTGPSRGSGTNDGDLDYLTIAFDASTGSVKWLTRNYLVAGGEDYPYAITVSPDGSNVATTGTFREAAGFTWGFGTVVYNAQTGANRWVRVYDSGINTGGAGWEVAFSADSGRLHVAGNAQKPGFSTRVPGIVTYDVETGATLWSERAIEFVAPDIPSMAVNPADGTVYFTTGALITNPINPAVSAVTVTAGPVSIGVGSTLDFDFLVLAYDGVTGARRWVKSYDFAHQTQFLTTVAVPAGGQTIAVAGITQQFYPQQINAITTISLDAATGSLRWDARWGLPLNADTFQPTKPFIGTGGSRVFVGASPGNLANWDYLVAAYNV